MWSKTDNRGRIATGDACGLRPITGGRIATGDACGLRPITADGLQGRRIVSGDYWPQFTRKVYQNEIRVGSNIIQNDVSVL